MKNIGKAYYLGLDVGTDSVGHAASDLCYKLLKFRGEPMWGVHLFDDAAPNSDRRAFRTARRRLDRRQHRIKLLQMLFAEEIGKIDPNFFVRIKESALFPEDTTDGAALFKDPDFNDGKYHEKYPTIHHLLMELLESNSPHDVRLVYLACAWLIAHRGHFLNEISKERINDILDITMVYQDLMAFFPEEKPWHCDDLTAFGDILRKSTGVTKKYKELCNLLFHSPKVPKQDDEYQTFPYSREALVKSLCGGTISAKELFVNEDYEEIEKFTLNKSDEELAPVLAALGDDAELIIKLKGLFDWGLLSDILQGRQWISEAKVQIYEQHKMDLSNIKRLVKTYIPKKYYEIFRATDTKKVNYEAYAKGNSARQEDFCKYIRGLLKNVSPQKKDEKVYSDVMERLENLTFCPKQVNSDNRVIPHQVYWVELKKILDQAAGYLPFLQVKEDGTTVAEKILSIFEFRIPYFVGPLNPASQYAWLKRKAKGKIYPWNFRDMVDLEASEQAFIDRMTNSCTYLPDADVLPKMSLCYERFQLLNEINPLAVNGKRISVELKQRLWQDLFMNRKKVSKKAVRDYLRSNNCYTGEELETLSGIDDMIKTSLSSHMAFRSLLERGVLSVQDAERIIQRRTYMEGKARFVQWLSREYSHLSEADRKYIGNLKFKDFGRLSREFLCELYGTESNSATGEAMTILDRMWNENLTLMEILSEDYTYRNLISEHTAAFYAAHPQSLDDRLEGMYISTSVKRQILRTLDVVSDVIRATGAPPRKIFIEMARGGKPDEKGKRIDSRYTQIINLYEQTDTEDVRQLTRELAQMGEAAQSRLQSDRLFLYYMQLGRCMYTGKRIELSQLSTDLYDIDHIYPQSKVKDDSVLNNKVLVLSTANAQKNNVYPIQADVRHEMAGWWRLLFDRGFLKEEKYRRLVRHEPFTEAEQWGFINRQLVETRQSTKALATILSERYPETEIVYVKAGLVSEFRQKFDMFKSRAVNDLHHAKDAYLNIVVGNVYSERFTKKWFMAHREDYNLKTETLFTHPVTGSDGMVIWEGKPALTKVKDVVHKNNAVHLTRYAFCRKGGLFDQQPCKAAEGLIPRKKDLPTEKYGGYNKTTASFFVLVKYQTGKKSDLMVMPAELLHAPQFTEDAAFAEAYAKKAIGSIIGKEILSVAFPMGRRKLKIGTIFEFDGSLRMYLTGKSGGGRQLGFSLICPLVVGYDWETYIKRLEKLNEKKKKNPNLVYSERYDEVSRKENLELYDILVEKLKQPVYTKRPANPLAALEKGREKFADLDVFDQTKCLLQIIMAFSRVGSCDLSLIDGVPKAAVVTLSSSVSNWKKNYADVRILDQSPSGLYCGRSGNLLELL